MSTGDANLNGMPDDDGIDANDAGFDAVDDATIVATPDDATIAVASDATIAVAHEAVPDETIAVQGDGSLSDAAEDATMSAGAMGQSSPAGPVVDGVEIPPSLAKLLFKRPLDPKRRAPESPFPKSQSSLPRGGVRPDIPVVYGARPEEFEPQSEGTDFARWIGPPPDGYALEATNRESLPSVARLNRQYSRLALFGGAGTLVVVVFGLWWIVQELF